MCVGCFSMNYKVRDNPCIRLECPIYFNLHIFIFIKVSLGINNLFRINKLTYFLHINLGFVSYRYNNFLGLGFCKVLRPILYSFASSIGFCPPLSGFASYVFGRLVLRPMLCVFSCNMSHCLGFMLFCTV